MILTSADITVTLPSLGVITPAVVTTVPGAGISAVPGPILYTSPTVLDRALWPLRPFCVLPVTRQCCGQSLSLLQEWFPYYIVIVHYITIALYYDSAILRNSRNITGKISWFSSITLTISRGVCRYSNEECADKTIGEYHVLQQHKIQGQVSPASWDGLKLGCLSPLQ